MNKYKIIKTKKFTVNLSQVESKEDVIKAFNNGLFNHFGCNWKTWHLDSFNDFFSWYEAEEGFAPKYHLTIIGAWKVQQELGKKLWETLNEILQTAEREGFAKLRYE